MTTQAPAACPIQISVVLDSGVFLTLVEKENYPECHIGYFAPTFMVYGDWELITSKDLTQPITSPDPTRPSDSPSLTWAQIGSRDVTFRHIDAGNNEKTPGVTLSKALLKHLLLRKDIYDGEGFSPPIIDARFDWIFKFYSGVFRCSSVKDRFFKQCNGYTNVPNTQRKLFKNIAHDIVVHFELEQDERLEILIGDRVLWNSSSSDYDGVRKRFDIEVVSPHSTAENYYRDALDHRGNDYWLPNQGDPGPMGGRP